MESGVTQQPNVNRNSPTEGIALLCGMEGRFTERPLHGCQNDVERIAALLPPGFELVRLVGEAATRGAILAALYGLLERARGKQIVVAMSCHGTHVEHRGMRHPMLVTNDPPTPEQPINGVLAVELWVLVAKLAALTPFVTVLLDCCHAEGIVRGEGPGSVACREGDPTPKWLEPQRWCWPSHFFACHPGAPTPEAWFDAIPADLLDPNGHPHVVRVAASSPEQVAFEGVDEQGRPCGLFTLLLDRALARAFTPPSWQQAIAWVRAMLASDPRARLQRPEVSGAVGRTVFGRTSEASIGSFALERDALGTWWLSGGRIHGVDRGDRFATHAGTLLHVVEVEELRARVERAAGREPIEAGSLAFLRGRSQRSEVAITAADADELALLDQLIASTPSLMPTRGAASLRVVAGREFDEIHDGRGRVSCRSERSGLLDALDACARTLAFSQVVRRPPGLPELAAWRFRCMRHREGHDVELHGGEQLELGDRLWYELENHSQGATLLYFNVVELRVDGHARCRNRDYAPAGLPTPAGRSSCLERRFGAPAGHRVEWPAHTPRDTMRTLELVFVASIRPLDLRAIMGVGQPGRLAWRGEPLHATQRWDARTLTLRLAP